MRYDVTKLKALRDNIDNFLEMERSRDQTIQEEVEKRVAEEVGKQRETLFNEFKEYIDQKIADQTKSD